MPTLSITKTYSDGLVLNEVDLDNIINDIQTFMNDTKLTSVNIQPDGIITNNIIDLAITTGKLDDLAVTTAKLNDLAVTTAKLNDLSVTTAKIDNLAVTTAKLALNSVDATILDETGTYDMVKLTLGSGPAIEKSPATGNPLIVQGTLQLANTGGTPTQGPILRGASQNVIDIINGSSGQVEGVAMVSALAWRVIAGVDPNGSNINFAAKGFLNFSTNAYFVFLTWDESPGGTPGALFHQNQQTTGFEIRDTGTGTGNVSWMVVGPY